MIVLEEAWALLKNPIFAAKIEDWLKTFRKLNAIVVFSTQSIEDAVRSPISPALIGQTATHVYFPNPKATDEYRTVFKLSEREVHLIREVLDKESRFFLLKQGRDSVVARADFSEMPDLLSVLSGRAETLAALERLRSHVGDDSASWLPLFQKEVACARHN
jgi:type IV secretion system protein VirB4